MTSKEALKRLKQETAPSTYMDDFDKNECIEIIQQDLNRLEKLKEENKKLKEDRRDILKEFAELEKVKEILQDYLMIKVSINKNNEYCLDACDYAIPQLNKEEYDLLKECL